MKPTQERLSITCYYARRLVASATPIHPPARVDSRALTVYYLKKQTETNCLDNHIHFSPGHLGNARVLVPGLTQICQPSDHRPDSIFFAKLSIDALVKATVAQLPHSQILTPRSDPQGREPPRQPTVHQHHQQSTNRQGNCPFCVEAVRHSQSSSNLQAAPTQTPQTTPGWRTTRSWKRSVKVRSPSPALCGPLCMRRLVLRLQYLRFVLAKQMPASRYLRCCLQGKRSSEQWPYRCPQEDPPRGRRRGCAEHGHPRDLPLERNARSQHRPAP